MRCSRGGTRTPAYSQLRPNLRERAVDEVANLGPRDTSFVIGLTVPLPGESADDECGLVAGHAKLLEELSVRVDVGEPPARPHVSRQLSTQVVAQEALHQAREELVA